MKQRSEIFETKEKMNFTQKSFISLDIFIPSNILEWMCKEIDEPMMKTLGRNKKRRDRVRVIKETNEIFL
jgi:hypothetical protein